MSKMLPTRKRKALCAFILLDHLENELEEETVKRQKKQFWVRSWLLKRQEKGCFHTLLDELHHEDPTHYRSWLRLDEDCFKQLLDMVTPLIKREDTVMREAISPAERLAVTLRYLATGETFSSLSYSFRISRQAISEIVLEVCKAIYTVLKGNFLKIPSTEEEWHTIAKRFEDVWQFPKCIGALDGKHVQSPDNSGSYYHNYKGTDSIVLMALVDADLQFVYVDVGTNGRVSDGGVWNKTTLCQALMGNKLHIPPPSPLPGRIKPVPFVVVADAAFSLKNHLMKPYPENQLNSESRVFNYRLSRARRCVENAFGVLANRMRVFRAPIALSPKKVEHIVLASTALHNFLRRQKTGRALYTPVTLTDREDLGTGDVLPGEWRAEPAPSSMVQLRATGSNNYATNAKAVREEFRDYFSTNGAVSWQQMFH
ncbi:hypothetical protein SKAU_G00208630 [Synaphobranchus kaupii]|uniref:DDE Tnp4 domain-containing protein n=1 Tax=Synaphobranchus kaupii TaxID=118154 RepID=A0A9Q1IUP6_SYNKA|nr:hypothetical protein SKAU_G00208630 [Synaphobranchus kaupii]